MNRILFVLLIIPTIVLTQTVPVTFHFKPASSPGSVRIAGSFNNWTTTDTSYLMKNIHGDGVYQKTISLTPGTYQYKFIVDGNWYADSDNLQTDGSQYGNSQILVADPMITYLTPNQTPPTFSFKNLPIVKAIIAFAQGTTVSAANLSLTVNGKSKVLLPTMYDSLTKQLMYPLASSEVLQGNNTISFSITTNKGKATASSSFMFDAAPSFSLLTEDMLYLKSNIVVYGRVDDPLSDTVTINLNGTPAPATVGADSMFKLPVSLTEGPNTISVSVSNGYAKAIKTQTITYDANTRPLVDVTTSVSNRTATLTAVASSPKGLPLTYEWSQPNKLERQISLTTGNSRSLTVDIPSIASDIYLRVKVTDSEGNFNYGGCILRSSPTQVRQLTIDEHSAWIDTTVLYEVQMGQQFKQFQEVTDKLDYLSDLGIGAIWMTPVFDGAIYSIRNYFKIDPNLGVEVDLSSLVKAAHAKGIKVVLDLVLNHTWTQHPMFQNVLALNSSSPFADYYIWTGQPGKSPFIYYYDWSTLPNLNVTNSEVVEYLIRVAEYWIRNFDVDGYRFDAAWGPEIRNPSMWTAMRTRLKKVKPDILLLGEAPVSNSYYVDRTYQLDLFSHKFDLAYDWDLRGWGTTGFPGIFTGQATVDQLHNIITGPLSANAFPMRFLENHDFPRAVTQFGINQSKLAHAIVFTISGLPLVYAGGEVGQTGALYDFTPINWSDPYNVRPYFKSLIKARTSFLRNTPTVLRLTNSKPAQVYSYVAQSDTNSLLVLANFSNSSQAFTTNTQIPSLRSDNYVLTDIVTNTTVQQNSSQFQSFSMSLNPWEAKVYRVQFGRKPTIQLSTIELQYSTVQLGSSKDLTFLLTNNGSDSLRISSLSSTNPAFVTRTLSAVIPAGGSLVDTVRFAPTTIGAFLAYLVIVSNTSTSPDTLRVSGYASLASSAERLDDGIPKTFALSQNYPNPFNPSTTIQFALPKLVPVTLKMYDLLGKEVSTLISQNMSPGYYSVRWGSDVPSGVYLYRLQAGSFLQTRKLILLK